MAVALKNHEIADEASTAFDTFVRQNGSSVDLQAADARLAELTVDTSDKLKRLISAIDRRTDVFLSSIGWKSAKDVDDLIDQFHQSEMEEISKRTVFERHVNASLKQAIEIAPASLPLLNRAAKIYLDMIDDAAKSYHDAKWRLMESRAVHSDSRGVGPVHGAATDLDEYLKSLG